MPQGERLPPWKHCLAGLSAGGTATLLLHPLDLIKIRFQVQDAARGAQAVGHTSLAATDVVPKYRNVYHAFRTIVREEGSASLFQGVKPAIIGSALSWGLYFFFYENAKARYRKMTTGNIDGLSTHQHLPVWQQLCSATEAGVATVLITNPIWLVKTRLQIQISSATGQCNETQGRVRQYRGLVDTFRTILAEEGFFGLYRGVGAALVLTSHGTIQFFSYEYLKEFTYSRRRSEGREGSEVMGHLDPIWMGSTSKFVASTVTYPYQVIKTRIQQRQMGIHYDGIIDCGRKILSREGWPAFYKGIGPNTFRVLPQSALIFYVYELVASSLKDQNSADKPV